MFISTVQNCGGVYHIQPGDIGEIYFSHSDHQVSPNCSSTTHFVSSLQQLLIWLQLPSLFSLPSWASGLKSGAVPSSYAQLKSGHVLQSYNGNVLFEKERVLFERFFRTSEWVERTWHRNDAVARTMLPETAVLVP